MSGEDEEYEGSSAGSDTHTGKGSYDGGGGDEAATHDTDSYDDRDRNVDTEQAELSAFTSDDDSEDAESQSDGQDVVEEALDAVLDEDEDITDDDLIAPDDDTNLPDEFYDSDISPDAPSEANIDRCERFVALEDAEEADSGIWSKGRTYIGHTPDGDAMFVKTFDTGYEDDREAHRIAKTVSEAIDYDALPDDRTPTVPTIHVDDERDAAAIEDAGEADSRPVKLYGGDVDKDKYLNAAAFKGLTADWDAENNIVTSSDGECYPIDYDMVGESGIEAERPLESALDNLGHVYDGGKQVKRLSFEVSRDEVRDRMVEIAEATDVEPLVEGTDRGESENRWASALLVVQAAKNEQPSD